MTPNRIPRQLRALGEDEPVMTTEAVKAAVTAVVTLLVVFGLFVPSPAQVAAILGAITVLYPLIAKCVRSRVTPAAKADAAAGDAWASGWVKGRRASGR